ncbi:hypothetical protein ACLQ9F_12000 [Bordetella avium]|uniref:hypothetical protein n=1 Tax=Bordetella avium TaxID=521 RepID=UPI000FDA6596|nr:hypothetical protein [Bordetella avium]AZY48843.1 hypothetical protein C0J09_06595 [Bordetella avium]AZY52223.1 hypothetical protein C0J07_06665 [Bordetella avium]
MSERNAPFPRLAVALAYAFSEERHILNRPAMARAADMRLGEPGPLSGADGCAEVGKVRQFLDRNLSPLHVAVLYARYGQRVASCKYCHSEADHPAWVAALYKVAMELGAHLSMRTVNSELLYALVRRYYDSGAARTLQSLADEYACKVRSVERASARANDWLRGTREKKGAEPIYGVEQAAHAVAEKILREGGFIP